MRIGLLSLLLLLGITLVCADGHGSGGGHGSSGNQGSSGRGSSGNQGSGNQGSSGGSGNQGCGNEGSGSGGNQGPRGDVVDREAIGEPYYGKVSKSGCLSIINWSNQPPPTGTWSNGHVVAPHCVYGPTAAVRGWNATNAFSAQTPIPLNGSQTEGLKERVREALRNAKRIARHYGADYDDFARTQFAVYDISIMRPIVNAIQAEPEFWGVQADYRDPKYPNRGIIGHRDFNGLDCLTPAGVIYRGVNNPATGQVDCASAADFAVGDVVEIDVLFVHRRGYGPDFPRGRN